MVNLYHGDCLEVMKEIPDGSVDMILCDLPYGTTACKWDSRIPFEPLWKQYKRVIKRNGVIALFGTEPFSSYMRMSNIEWYKYDWIWRKNTCTGFQHAKNMPLKDYEIISVFSPGSMGHIQLLGDKRMPYNPQGITEISLERGGGTRKFGSVVGKRPSQKERYVQYAKDYPRMIIEIDSVSKRAHQTQKPVPLLEYLIRTYTNDGETVMDNCMGSGSTGVACVNTGRDFIGIELDTGYFQTAKRRIEEAQEQMRLGAANA